MIEKFLDGGLVDTFVNPEELCCCGCDCSGKSTSYGHGYHAGIGDGARDKAQAY